MGGGQGFTWSIDFDYLIGNFDEMQILKTLGIFLFK